MQITLLFKCLSDDTRLRSIALLHKTGKLCVCELTAALAVSQPKISRHLAYLRQCGLVIDEREGQWVYYRINPGLPGWAVALIDDVLIAAEATELIKADYLRLQNLLNQAGAPTCC